MAASRDLILETINNYVTYVGAGAAEKLVALFAEGSTVEDPVGSEVRTTRESIREFYATLEGRAESASLGNVKIADGQAAFSFELRVRVGDTTYAIAPIDVMTFDDDGRITSMRAFWSGADMTVA
jgi:steroid delta-isomerase